jgi:hypothetical protein
MHAIASKTIPAEMRRTAIATIFHSGRGTQKHAKDMPESQPTHLYIGHQPRFGPRIAR